jgi:hypothetical protein
VVTESDMNLLLIKSTWAVHKVRLAHSIHPLYL